MKRKADKPMPADAPANRLNAERDRARSQPRAQDNGEQAFGNVRKPTKGLYRNGERIA